MSYSDPTVKGTSASKPGYNPDKADHEVETSRSRYHALKAADLLEAAGGQTLEIRSDTILAAQVHATLSTAAAQRALYFLDD